MALFNLRVSDVMAAVDELEPNQYETTMKMDWLSTLDGEIWQELVMTHEFRGRRRFPRHLWKGDPLDQGIRGTQYPPWPPHPPRPEPEAGEEETPEREIEEDVTEEAGEPGGGGRDRREGHRFWRWPYYSPDDILIAGNPYGKDMYVYWLQSKIAYHNAEQAKYAIYSAAYNDAYRNFSAWYNRTHMPAMEHGGNRLKF